METKTQQESLNVACKMLLSVPGVTCLPGHCGIRRCQTDTDCMSWERCRFNGRQRTCQIAGPIVTTPRPTLTPPSKAKLSDDQNWSSFALLCQNACFPCDSVQLSPRASMGAEMQKLRLSGQKNLSTCYFQPRQRSEERVPPHQVPVPARFSV